MSDWITTIGLEIHAQLITNSKIFSSSPNKFGSSPNVNASLIDLGFPGTLPTINESVIKQAVKFGIATNADIAKFSVFARKNYFYPDLPKNYQISQYENPIIIGGSININLEDGSEKKIELTRAHLEEDAGKSIHDQVNGKTYLDLNRAGTPLLEIVSEPQISNSFEAVQYMKKIHEIVTSLEICDGNMQEGSFRCDANVSVRKTGQEKLGTRTELKNINSFKFIEKAIEYEVDRQIEVLESGGKINQETRLYDEKSQTTRSMRSKEEANDYRYFPDPDLLPICITKDYINKVKSNMPMMPEERKRIYHEEYLLNDDQVNILSGNIEISNYMDKIFRESSISPKEAMNLFMKVLYPIYSKQFSKIIEAEIIVNAINLMNKKNIDSYKMTQILKEMTNSNASIEELLNQENVNAEEFDLEKIIKEIADNNPQLVKDYKNGKQKVIGFFVGQILKATNKKCNPAEAKKKIEQYLKNS